VVYARLLAMSFGLMEYSKTAGCPTEDRRAEDGILKTNFKDRQGTGEIKDEDSKKNFEINEQSFQNGSM